jgi:hypothetical protein
MKIQPVLSCILALALLGACKSSTTVVQNDVGIIQGKVAISVNCNALSNDSGATVQIEGTGFSTTTNSLGDWTMNNVPAGIYNIIITKPGFDTDLIAQDQFSGAGTQFLENGAISATSPLPDSVLISSIQITKNDSIIITKDSAGNNVYDTIGYEYSLNITFIMNGPDSAIAFAPALIDTTPDSSSLNDGFMNFPQGVTSISRNQSIVRTGTIYSRLWEYPKGVYQPGSPRPGDTIVVTTTPSPSITCEGRKVINVSKSFVLP